MSEQNQEPVDQTGPLSSAEKLFNHVDDDGVTVIKATGAYLIKHPGSGCFYVGSTGEFARRRRVHKSKLINGVHHCYRLQALYDQDPNVVFFFRETATREEAYEIEIQVSKDNITNPLLLNTERVVIRGHPSGKISESHRQALSTALRGREISDIARQRMAEAKRGTTASTETKDKMTASQLAHYREHYSTSELRKERIKAAQLASQKPVTIDGVTYPSVDSASKALDMEFRSIRRRLLSDNPSYSEWRYLVTPTSGDSENPPERLRVNPEDLFLSLEDDGTRVLNVYSKGRTELGRFLSNFELAPFLHPEYGHFSSVEAFWYWLKTGKQHDHLRRLYGMSAKSAGQRLPIVPMIEGNSTYEQEQSAAMFEEEICNAIRLKLESNARMKALFVRSVLPFVHCYVYGDRVVQVPKHEWQMDCLESLRKQWQQEAESLMIA